MEFVKTVDIPMNTKGAAGKFVQVVLKQRQYYDENLVSNIDKAAVILLNYLLEHKAKDTRWVVNWKVNLTNNSLSRLVGQALISNETVKSYELVFQTLVMNTRAAPLTIITNKDLAINAIIA
ncbi:20602_t:CDS:2, partial [Gigaspora rosea]